jgi:Holliday junction resolvasome RuvABC endonuclease subunit
VFKRLCAIDPSLKASGWVVFDIASEAPLRAGVISAMSAQVVLAKRLSDFQAQVESLYSDLEFGQDDIAILEGPAPLVLNPDSSMKVEQVRGIFESVARSRGVLVPGRINPRTVQSEILGLNGKQQKRSEVKDAARQVAERLYGAKLEEVASEEERKAALSQDIIDAALVGAVALSRIKLSGGSGTDLAAVLSSYGHGNRVGRRKRVRWTEANLKSLGNAR